MEKSEDKKELMRQRSKGFASKIIRLYCELPKNRMECQVIGKQLSRKTKGEKNDENNIGITPQRMAAI
jgi:hypothetical protein